MLETHFGCIYNVIARCLLVLSTLTYIWIKKKENTIKRQQQQQHPNVLSFEWVLFCQYLCNYMIWMPAKCVIWLFSIPLFFFLLDIVCFDVDFILFLLLLHININGFISSCFDIIIQFTVTLFWHFRIDIFLKIILFDLEFDLIFFFFFKDNQISSPFDINVSSNFTIKWKAEQFAFTKNEWL